MQIISKIEMLDHVAESNGIIRLEALRVGREIWNPIEAGNVKITIDDLVEIAAENLVKYRDSEKTLLVTVETPGLRVIHGGNPVKKASTVLSPKPSYLRRILFIKCRDSVNCDVIYEFKPKIQLVVYEGSIELLKNIDYDFIILECEDYKRVLFPYELSIPAIKDQAKKPRKKRRKQKEVKTCREKKKKTRRSKRHKR